MCVRTLSRTLAVPIWGRVPGKVGRAFHTLVRFVGNTTIGVGGLADHASSMGLEEKPEDFGQPLATWGVNAGPYVMLPLLGPSTLRDAVGFGVEVAGDPGGLAVTDYSGLSGPHRLALPAMADTAQVGRAYGWGRIGS